MKRDIQELKNNLTKLNPSEIDTATRKHFSTFRHEISRHQGAETLAGISAETKWKRIYQSFIIAKKPNNPEDFNQRAEAFQSWDKIWKFYNNYMK